MQNNPHGMDSHQGKTFIHEVSQHVIQEGGEALLQFNPKMGELEAHLKSGKGKPTGIDFLCGYLSKAISDVISPSLGDQFYCSPTVQSLCKVHLRPDIGCFVQFDGDYSGLLILNFSGPAAVAIYQAYMIQMGMPKEELSDSHTSDDVIDSIGELVNQIIGKFRKKVEDAYGLQTQNSQPKAININESITLSIGPTQANDHYRRLSLKVAGHPFQAELAFEQTQFHQLLEL